MTTASEYPVQPRSRARGWTILLASAVVGIIRDLAIIAVLAVVMVYASGLMRAFADVGNSGGGVPSPTPTCTPVEVDC